MPKTLCQTTTLLFFLTMSCSETESGPPHNIAKEKIPLVSPRGQKLLGEVSSHSLSMLKKYWVQQKRSHCGAASAVIILNSFLGKRLFFQDSLFSKKTKHIITQDVVFDIGFTGDELRDMIRAHSDLEVEYYSAGENKNDTSYKKFLKHCGTLSSKNNQIIVLYSRESITGEGVKRGHFSPIAAYNSKEKMILILEVNKKFEDERWGETFWVSTKDMYSAMSTTDPVADRHRGWLHVLNSNKQERQKIQKEVDP